jgi:hypothetical protein
MLRILWLESFRCGNFLVVENVGFRSCGKFGVFSIAKNANFFGVVERKKFLSCANVRNF